MNRLNFLKVEDFRSIRGQIAVSLDAPVVLIHGPNGTGKTSLLTAIELALTGAVSSLARFDFDHLSHLPHKLAKDGSAHIELRVHSENRQGVSTLTATGREIKGLAYLAADDSRFYTERCYLAQATLGRLLEIYEHQDSRRSDSPLTTFVKEMLGLEALDELIEGLRPAADIRRFRELSPLFWSARVDAPLIETNVEEARANEHSLRLECDRIAAKLRELLRLVGETDAADITDIRPKLQELVGASEAHLMTLARIRRDVVGASNQVEEEESSNASAQRLVVDREDAAAREQLVAWQDGPGRELEKIISEVRKEFPDVPPLSPDPATSHMRSSQAVISAQNRLQSLSAEDDEAEKALTDLREAIRQGRGRIEQIDHELSDARGVNTALAEALTAIASHISGEHCPVCDRDFGEVSTKPLAAHVSEKVAGLVTMAGRLEALVRDRAATVGAIATAERREAEIQSKRLPSVRRDSLKLTIATLSELGHGLTRLQETAAEGSRLFQQASIRAQAVSIFKSRELSIAGLRAELAQHASTLSLPQPRNDQPLQTVLHELLREIERQSAEETRRSSYCGQALTAIKELIETRKRLLEAEATSQSLQDGQTKASSRRREAMRRIALAKDLASRAQLVRSAEVRRVFNDELNEVWRDLFIRLAPDEAFVPAFSLPDLAGRPVEAVLETHYRSGGRGGNPRAMLSAGNLNTAALTLFLALHLSAPPILPWLVIDDPVQSMDDVHISQFAALLRSLKQHGRQVIIAVHDRQLFDYLTLELSPAFNGDRLITIELGRNADGLTTAPWNLLSFEPDKAIAA